MKETVIIAAAGVGSRLGAGIPKCLVEVGGHAVFEYQLRAFDWADEIRMVVGYHADEVIERVSAVNDKVIFVRNQEYSTTGLRQSYYLGAQGITGKALFLDGDTIMGSAASSLIHEACKAKEDFITVVQTLSENPIYAGVQNGKVQWFSYERQSEYELANAAFMDAERLEYLNTLFYVQLEQYLPAKAVFIESLEIDTPADLRRAEQVIAAHPAEYDFWRSL